MQSRVAYKVPARTAVLLVSVCLAGCGPEEVPTELRIVGGDADAGRAVIAAFECGVCHHVPGVIGAHGVVGPPLSAFGRRQFIAGVVPNTPAILVKWVQDAPSLAPETAMPSLPLSERQARDVAAYLYTLR